MVTANAVTLLSSGALNATVTGVLLLSGTLLRLLAVTAVDTVVDAELPELVSPLLHAPSASIESRHGMRFTIVIFPLLDFILLCRNRE